MFEFFDQIGSFLSGIVDFIVTIFENLVMFFQMIATSFSFIIEVCSILPVPIKAGCVAIIAVSVIYLIVGRE